MKILIFLLYGWPLLTSTLHEVFHGPCRKYDTLTSVRKSVQDLYYACISSRWVVQMVQQPSVEKYKQHMGPVASNLSVIWISCGQIVSTVGEKKAEALACASPSQSESPWLNVSPTGACIRLWRASIDSLQCTSRLFWSWHTKWLRNGFSKNLKR
jgi:hypothetical protein